MTTARHRALDDANRAVIEAALSTGRPAAEITVICLLKAHDTGWFADNRDAACAHCAAPLTVRAWAPAEAETICIPCARLLMAPAGGSA